MAKVKVIHIPTGKKGYIDENDFDTRKFKLDQSWWEKQVNSGILPVAGAAVGGLGGFLAGGSPGAYIGGAGGYATGKVAQDLSKINYGTYDTPKNYTEALDRGIGNIGEAGIAGGVTGGIGAILSLLNIALHPGQTRANLINKLPDDKRLVSEEEVQEKMLGVPQKYITLKPEQESRKLIQSMNQKLFPWQGGTDVQSKTQTPVSTVKNIDLNNLYNQIRQLEQETSAYRSETPKAIAGKDLSIALRGLANEKGGRSIQFLNDYMKMLNSLNPYATKVKYGAAGAASAAGTWGIINKLRGK